MEAVEIGKAALGRGGRFDVDAGCRGPIDDAIACPSRPSAEVGVLEVEEVALVQQADLVEHAPAERGCRADDVFHIARGLVTSDIRLADAVVAG